MFNAGLVIRNEAGLPVPYLSENVPQLHSDTWQIFPDGTMETIYRLKANAIWHDGQPLTADDFVFSYEVYASPQFGLAGSPPLNFMERVTARDLTSVVIRWNSSYPQAGELDAEAFPPLPRHILGQAFLVQDTESFIANPFWSLEYIGAGPYKLERWEPGAFLEGVAFNGHVFGAPRIARIRELFIPDANTVVSNLLAGAVHLTTGCSIGFEQGRVLQQQWGDSGTVLDFPGLLRNVNIQLRPEYAMTQALLDLRVRQALTHAVDRDAFNDGVYDGRAVIAHTRIQPTVSYYADVDRAITKYPFDRRKVEQLMSQAGLSRGSDGVWSSPTYGRVAFEAAHVASPQNTNELVILAGMWRDAGFDVKEIAWSPAYYSDNREVRSTFPGVWSGGTPAGDRRNVEYKRDRIPTEANRWTGSNLGGWLAPPDFDRAAEIFETNLERNQRNQASVQMAKILSEQAVFIPVGFRVEPVAAATGLKGPRIHDPEGSDQWNLHEWEFR